MWGQPSPGSRLALFRTWLKAHLLPALLHLYEYAICAVGVRPFAHIADVGVLAGVASRARGGRKATRRPHRRIRAAQSRGIKALLLPAGIFFHKLSSLAGDIGPSASVVYICVSV